MRTWRFETFEYPFSDITNYINKLSKEGIQPDCIKISNNVVYYFGDETIPIGNVEMKRHDWQDCISVTQSKESNESAIKLLKSFGFIFDENEKIKSGFIFENGKIKYPDESQII
jgi:hypothetical protein